MIQIDQKKALPERGEFTYAELASGSVGLNLTFRFIGYLDSVGLDHTLWWERREHAAIRSEPELDAAGKADVGALSCGP
jgi:hypothetical protein